MRYSFSCNGGQSNCLGWKGDIDGAVREHREAVRPDPANTYAHYNLAVIHFEKGGRLGRRNRRVPVCV